MFYLLHRFTTLGGHFYTVFHNDPDNARAFLMWKMRYSKTNWYILSFSTGSCRSVHTRLEVMDGSTASCGCGGTGSKQHFSSKTWKRAPSKLLRNETYKIFFLFTFEFKFFKNFFYDLVFITTILKRIYNTCRFTKLKTRNDSWE